MTYAGSLFLEWLLQRGIETGPTQLRFEDHPEFGHVTIQETGVTFSPEAWALVTPVLKKWLALAELDAEIDQYRKNIPRGIKVPAPHDIVNWAPDELVDALNEFDVEQAKYNRQGLMPDHPEVQKLREQMDTYLDLLYNRGFVWVDGQPVPIPHKPEESS